MNNERGIAVACIRLGAIRIRFATGFLQWVEMGYAAIFGHPSFGAPTPEGEAGLEQGIQCGSVDAGLSTCTESHFSLFSNRVSNKSEWAS
jgi:hypothetical protein